MGNEFTYYLVEWVEVKDNIYYQRSEKFYSKEEAFYKHDWLTNFWNNDADVIEVTETRETIL
mgnify:CR=1 FL=1